MIEKSKKCYKCKNIKHHSCFHKNKSNRDGLHTACKVCRKILTKTYRKNNKDTIKKYLSNYYLNNRDKILESSLSYYYENKHKVSFKKVRAEYERKRKSEDSLYKLKASIRRTISDSIRRKGFTKKSNTYKILGCSYEQFKKYLENNPYGYTIEDSGLDLDHIIPISYADNNEEILLLNHYSNFQLLPKYYNRFVKSNKEFDKNDFKSWLNKKDK